MTANHVIHILLAIRCQHDDGELYNSTSYVAPALSEAWNIYVKLDVPVLLYFRSALLSAQNP